MLPLNNPIKSAAADSICHLAIAYNIIEADTDHRLCKERGTGSPSSLRMQQN